MKKNLTEIETYQERFILLFAIALILGCYAKILFF